MTIAVGDTLPNEHLLRIGKDGPETVSVADLTAGKLVALFAVPGAFTPTCHQHHLPSFVRTREGLARKGVHAIVCIAVNDPFVVDAWGTATGAHAAGIEMMADPAGTFTKALGLAFDVPQAGLWGRSRRCAMLVEDGVVRVFRLEDTPGVCEATTGEALLAAAG